MNWPSRILGRAVWCRMRFSWWISARLTRSPNGDRGEPAWWPAFEQAFRSLDQEQPTAESHPIRTTDRRSSPRSGRGTSQ